MLPVKEKERKVIGMTGCESYRDLLSAGLDGRLTPGEQDALRRHMETCAECRSLLELYAELAEEELTAPVPDTLVSGAMARIAKEPRRNHRRWIGLAVGVAACVALVTAALPGSLRLGLHDKAVMTAAATDEKAESAAVGLAAAAEEPVYGDLPASEEPAAPPMADDTSEAMVFMEEAMEEAEMSTESDKDADSAVYDAEAWRLDPVLAEYYGEILYYGAMPESIIALGADYLKTIDGNDWYTLPVSAESALEELLDEEGSYCWLNGNPDAENLVILAEITQ